MLDKSSFSKPVVQPGGRTHDLDQARVSSMADEGGTSGATMDAQEAALDIEVVPVRPWASWLAVGVIAGCAAIAGALLFGTLGRTTRRRRWLFG